MKKHAYLIMAHGNFHVLQALLKMLDDERNDIYIHIDRKVKVDIPATFLEYVRYAELHFLEKRINVSWGGYSQVRAELLLLKEAVKTEHAYYHLLSGVDLPLKSQNEIHKFFSSNYGKEFISIDNVVNMEDLSDPLINRVKYFYLFQDHIGRNPGRFSALLYAAQQGLLKIQKHLGVCRITANTLQLYKGGNWFSITHEMAKYVLSREKQIHNMFRLGICVDEMFLQTIAMNSPFMEQVTGNCMRYIDWQRGNPYTFVSSDYFELVNNEKLFARKFDEKNYDIVQQMVESMVLHDNQ